MFNTITERNFQIISSKLLIAGSIVPLSARFCATNIACHVFATSLLAHVVLGSTADRLRDSQRDRIVARASSNDKITPAILTARGERPARPPYHRRPQQEVIT
jgi:hypothetical protein